MRYQSMMNASLLPTLVIQRPSAFNSRIATPRALIIEQQAASSKQQAANSKQQGSSGANRSVMMNSYLLTLHRLSTADNA